ncbi:MAG: OmpA family protein [Flavobacteriales bacterium]
MASKGWLSFFLFFLGFLAKAQLYQFTPPQRLGTMVNSSADESNPVYSVDQQTLYFVRTYETKNTGGIYDQDIWVSQLKKGQWGSPKPLYSLNNKWHNAVVAEQYFTSDSTTLLYLNACYQGEKEAKKGIHIAEKKKGDSLWILKQKIPIPSLSFQGKYANYYLSFDAKVILFSYEGSDSEGEEDLYYSLFTEDGWSEPEHMGSVINSPGYEISPFLSKNNDTLFFASDGHKGLGQGDIYYAVRKNNWTSWTKPVNLGPTINTPYFDAYFSLNGNKATWSSNREGKDLDLWCAQSIMPPKLKYESKITKISGFQNADGSIEISVLSGIPPYKYQWSNGQVVSKIQNLRKGDYTLTIIDSIGQKISTSFRMDEPEAEEQKRIRFPNVQYEYNKWTFINDQQVNSYDSLKVVAQLLREYPQLVIELISHTDARGEAERNQILSLNRAKACYIYLVQQEKIDPRRIIPVGLGESEPATWFDADKKERITLTEDYIQQFKDDPTTFEKLNQLNRRTEGRILRLDFNPQTAPKAPREYMEFQVLP